MSPTTEQIRALAARCEQFREAKAPGGYRNSLALCIVDSVQSTGIRYGTTAKVVNQYRDYRAARGGDPETDGASELLQTFADLKTPEAWATSIGTDNKTSTHAGAPLKAFAIREVSQAMIDNEVETAADLRDAAEDLNWNAAVERNWRAVPGQRPGVTWHYVQILAGIPGIKPDRMIIRFVADSLGLSRRRVSSDFARDALLAAADKLDMSATDLDHAVWRWQRQH